MAYSGGWCGLRHCRFGRTENDFMIQMNCMYRTLLAAVAPAVTSVFASIETFFVPAAGDIQAAIDLAASTARGGAGVDASEQTNGSRGAWRVARLAKETRGKATDCT